jgi:hypothetical protein
MTFKTLHWIALPCNCGFEVHASQLQFVNLEWNALLYAASNGVLPDAAKMFSLT